MSKRSSATGVLSALLIILVSLGVAGILGEVGLRVMGIRAPLSSEW